MSKLFRSMETGLYETDFYGWTMQQSKLLALGKLFRLGMALVLSETPIKKSLLPNTCPYNLEQLLDSSFPDDLDVEF